MASSSTLSPIDDLTYDVITVLQKKARALEAYDKYLSDADAEDDIELKELFSSMRKQDEEDVQVLKEALARRLEDDLAYDEADDEADEEDYDEADDDEIEEPTPDRGETTAGASKGSGESPAGRGESTQRHR